MAEEKKTDAAEAPGQTADGHAAVAPVICLGASAGGLKSLEAFFAALPAKSGLVFAAVTHADPDQNSLLPGILERKTAVPVKTVEPGMRPEPDTAYAPPSDKDLVIEGGVFQLKDREKKDGLHLPVDRFLESLALDRGPHAGCIILSGTGTDGAQGLRRIKEAGGMAMAEAESSADHYGMPRSAIETGLTDYILEPREMPGRLIEYFKRQAAVNGAARTAPAEKNAPKEQRRTADFLDDVVALLAARTQHDFSHYKKSTLIRRIERRISVTFSKNAGEYLDRLRDDPDESQALFQELLIGVTEFFRDPEAFVILKQKVLPDLFSRLGKDDHLRMWAPGCATGEEVYSAAMVVKEYMTEHNIKKGMQIFGTDIDPRAVDKAREGIYPQNIAARIAPARLERFFIRKEDRYQVKNEIREPAVFAVQDILRDPPFTSLDLLFCRNLLIYLDAEAQSRLIPLFHYSLKPEGVLVLGASESVGRFGEFFTPIDNSRLYRKRAIAWEQRPAIDFPLDRRKTARASGGAPAPGPDGSGGPLGMIQALERLLLDRHTPACVLVDRLGRIRHVHGRTGKFLELPAGKPDLEVTGLAREGLRYPMTAALRQAAAGSEARHRRVRVKTNGGFEEIDLAVIPLTAPAALENTRLVVFAEAAPPPEAGEKAPDDMKTDDVVRRNLELENELIRVREDYRGALEELETSNEELKSLNEEMHSANEELQSTNEELESSREELQSLNEELNTVNSQLLAKNEELSKAYSAVTDVLNSTGIAILFLNPDNSVKRFTPEAAVLLNLVNHDVGRPIRHISHNLDIDDLAGKAAQVMKTLSPFEAEVRTREGRWLRMCIMVTRTSDNVLDSVVLTFIDIDAQKSAQEELRDMKDAELAATRRFSESIVETVREALLVLDVDFYVLTANRRFYQVFDLPEDAAAGKRLFEVGDRRMDTPELRKLLDRLVAEGRSFEDYEITHAFPDGEMRLLLNARLLKENGRVGRKILLAMEDVTDRPYMEKGGA